MSPKRVDDSENDDWRDVRSRDVETFYKWVIGSLISVIVFAAIAFWGMVRSDLNELKATTKEIQVGQAGIMRENMLQDEAIRKVQTNLDQHSALVERDTKEYHALRDDYLSRFGYKLNTRGGEEVLLKQPMKGDLQ